MARKRNDEQVSALIERLHEKPAVDWEEGFETLPDEEASELKSIAFESRQASNEGLTMRQDRTEVESETDRCS